MFQAIYFEEELANHPRKLAFCERYPKIPHISCAHYGEVFNRKGQNFRLQKKNPSLILAKKNGNFVHRTPPGYGVGSADNFYFSHMLNCIFDCRYCFLQGMFRSANYVVFVNFEDFHDQIIETINTHESCTFFSGYDCDSLALEPLTHFVEEFLPLFAKHPKAQIELRTKSTNIQFLLKQKPLQNCIVAFSLTPHAISSALEHKTPSLQARLAAMEKLNEWPIGLRFDPLIICENFKEQYAEFFSQVFEKVPNPHSVTMGPFRMPKGFLKNIEKLYPEEKLFAKKQDDQELIDFCQEEILKYIPKEKLFTHHIL